MKERDVLCFQYYVYALVYALYNEQPFTVDQSPPWAWTLDPGIPEALAAYQLELW